MGFKFSFLFSYLKILISYVMYSIFVLFKLVLVVLCSIKTMQGASQQDVCAPTQPCCVALHRAAPCLSLPQLICMSVWLRNCVVQYLCMFLLLPSSLAHTEMQSFEYPKICSKILCSSLVILGQGRAVGEVARLAREPPGN